MSTNNPITQAIDVSGGVVKLATLLGVTYQAVKKWEKKGWPPPLRAIQIEEATGGSVSRQSLRPDIYPEEAADPYRSALIAITYLESDDV